MADLAVLQTDPRAFARLRSALKGEHRMRRYEKWASLSEALESDGFHGCIVDLDDPVDPLALGDVIELRRAHPLLAIVVCADFRDRQLDLFHLGQIGVDSIILADRENEVSAIRSAVIDGLASAVAARVTRGLGDGVPARALDCLRVAIERADGSFRVKDLASRLSVRADTLNRQLRRQGLPSANRFLIWGRLFRATQLLGFRGATVESVAYAVGYSSAAALTRTLKRFSGWPPATFANGDGVVRMMEAFCVRGLGRTSTLHHRWRLRARRSAGTTGPYTYH